MKGHSIALVITKKCNSKTTMRYHYTTSPMAVIKRQIGTNVACFVLFCIYPLWALFSFLNPYNYVFHKTGRFWLLFIKIFSFLFYSLYFCDSNIIYTLWLSYKVLQLLFLVHFSLCPQIGWFLLIYLQVHWIFLFSTLLLYSAHILNFKCCIFHCFSVEIS